MKLKFLFAFASSFALNLFGDEKAENSSTSLFNGKDLAGWHSDVPAADKDPDVKALSLIHI